ncbi:MAG: GNAT family N-acetyltransferase, partial [Candidatus Gracilibacteria bacterium]|nr:GNAT family N-acetyltransferase [Candidatus Gracilibacteria bacterium]
SPQSLDEMDKKARESTEKLLAISVRPISINNKYDIESVLALETKVFGEGFLGRDDLLLQLEYCRDGNINNAIGIFHKGKMVGFGICYLGGKWSSIDIDIDPSFSDISDIGYIKTIIVDPSLQGRNIGQMILSSMIHNARKIGNRQLLLHAWDGSPNDSSRLFFEKNGGRTVKIYKRKWYQDSMENGWNCSKCGNPCECSSIEMIIDI